MTKFTLRLLIDWCASFALNIKSRAQECRFLIDCTKRYLKTVILDNRKKHFSVPISPESVEHMIVDNYILLQKGRIYE